MLSLAEVAVTDRANRTGGEMRGLIDSLDWAATPLGPIEGWPQSLKTSVSICLNSQFAMVTLWGRDLVFIYNSAYARILGAKHPFALGRPCREIWPEVWPTIGPMLEGVLVTGEGTISNDLMLLLERHGYAEECYFTFSYSPIHDETGGVGGVFSAVIETTDKVLRERRLKTLRDLADAGKEEGEWSANAVLRAAVRVAARNPFDMPFVLAYAVTEDGGEAVLIETVGVRQAPSLAPKCIRLSDATEQVMEHAFLRAVRERRNVEVALPDLGETAMGAWKIPPSVAIVMPLWIAGHESPSAFAVCGINPHKCLDAESRDFFQLFSSELASAITLSAAYASERRRAEALAEIDRAKTEFFTNISHEFRTPLTLILQPLAELREAALPSVHAERIEVAQRSSRRLLRLVNSLLDFSRIEAGRFRACYVPLDIAAYTSDVASTFRSVIEKAGLKYIVDCRPVSKPVFVDAGKWEQVVLNLLSNAFKFTLAGEIVLSLSEDTHGVELQVLDTGLGIPANEQARIFDRFYRVREMAGRSFEGSGIGLSLVRELVHMHGGEIDFESSAGVGSCFRVRLPFGRSHLPADQVDESAEAPPPVRAADQFVDEALRWLPEGVIDDSFAGQKSSEQDDGVAKVADAEKPFLLVADDNADMRAALQRTLQRRYRVRAVTNGREALAALRSETPDLLLTDVMMPELDGIGLLETIRADPQLRALPVILLSARAGTDERVEALQSRPDDYIVKPYRASELLVRIEQQLALAALRSEVAEREREIGIRDERLRAAEEVRLSEERFRQLTRLSSDWYWEQDEHLRFSFVSVGAKQNLGLDPQDFIGKLRWESDFVPVADKNWTLHRADLEARRPFRDYEVFRMSEDGDYWWVSLSGEPIFEANGRFSGYRGVARDITMRVRADRVIRESEARQRYLAEQLAIEKARLVSAQAVGRVGSWETDLESFVVSWSEETHRIFETDPLTFRPTHAGFLQRVHPDDREMVDNAFVNSRSSAVPQAIEHRILLPEGRIKVVVERWQIFTDADGTPRSAIGTCQDVTDRVKAEQALYESRHLLERAQEIAGLGYWEYDPVADRASWSATLFTITGVSSSQPRVRLEDILQLIHPDDRERVRAELARLIRDGSNTKYETRITRDDGELRYLLVHAESVTDGAGRVIKLIGTCMDITEQRQAAEEMRALSRRLVETQEIERRQIAAELHDRVGQNLTALSINLEMLRTMPRSYVAEIDKRLHDSRRLVEATSSIISDVMGELRPSMLEDVGLGSTLSWYGEEFQERTGIRVHFRAAGDPIHSLPKRDLALFRITQEALNNVAKHAHASRVDILLSKSEAGITLVLRDDGDGMDEQVMQRDRAHLGMQTMRERADVINGSLVVYSTPGRGTTVTVRVPA